jgi:hypothetical protein
VRGDSVTCSDGLLRLRLSLRLMRLWLLRRRSLGRRSALAAIVSKCLQHDAGITAKARLEARTGRACRQVRAHREFQLGCLDGKIKQGRASPYAPAAYGKPRDEAADAADNKVWRAAPARCHERIQGRLSWRHLLAQRCHEQPGEAGLKRGGQCGGLVLAHVAARVKSACDALGRNLAAVKQAELTYTSSRQLIRHHGPRCAEPSDDDELAQ